MRIDTLREVSSDYIPMAVFDRNGDSGLNNHDKPVHSIGPDDAAMSRDEDGHDIDSKAGSEWPYVPRSDVV